MKLPVGICFLVIGLLFTCTKPITKHPETITTTPIKQELRPLSYTKKIKKDTLNYIIAFHDTVQRRDFAASLEKLIKNSSSPAPDDSSNACFVKSQMITAPKAMSEAQTLPPKSAMEPGRADSSLIKHLPPPPRSGGSIVIYTPYGSLQPPLSLLTEAFPFDKKSCGMSTENSPSKYFTIKESSDRKITLELTSSARTIAGKQLSAFDMVTGWSNFVKRHPAEGKALFRHVAGLDQFIDGREALIMGFQIVDEKTIALRFSQPDNFALQRLCTSRLFPRAFSAGPYVAAVEKSDMLSLTPNPQFPGGPPFLQICEIRQGKDNNPFLAYSLNRYTAIVLFSKKDLEYARRIATDKSEIMVFSENRYFLSIALQSEGLRHWLGRSIDRKDILSNAIKAEGAPLDALEPSDSTDISALSPPAPAPAAGAPVFGAPVIILFCNDDPVSQIIGNKLLADLSRRGITCTLKGLSTEEYEKSLLKKDYGVAVGWTPQSVLTDQNERLRVAAMWFSDELNERARIDSMRELPLFSVTAYLLHNKKLVINKDDVTGMFLQE